MSQYFDEVFTQHRVIAILRGMAPMRAVAVAEQAWDLGIGLVEVTVEVPDAIETLAAVVAAGRERGMDVGAGTVITRGQFDAVAAVGVQFIVSPGLDTSMIEWTRRIDVPYLPGVMTPSEVQRAVAAGLSYLKVFPASVVGPQWLSTLAGPFPAVKFIATGGLDAYNAEAFLSAGACAVGIGSALQDPDQIPLLAGLAPQGPRSSS